MPSKLDPIKEALVMARRAEVRDLAVSVKGWHAMYHRVRLCCERCEGYMVYLTRQKFAACTNQPDGCKFSMRAPVYLAKKADVVEFLTVGTERDLAAYLVKEAQHGVRTSAA